jgi:hypothetical protein
VIWPERIGNPAGTGVPITLITLSENPGTDPLHHQSAILKSAICLQKNIKNPAILKSKIKNIAIR